MKCPKCGNEIPEGKLLCEKCGEEVKIVPEFEPEYEAQINETMKKIAKSFLEQETLEDSILDEDWKEEKTGEQFAKIFQNHKAVWIVGGCALFCVLITVCSIHAVHKKQYHSFLYQYEKALGYMEDGVYDTAGAYLDRALAIDQSRTDARILLADIYEKQGHMQSAITVLEELLPIADDFYRSDVEKRLLSLYLTQKNYEKMGSLLAECVDEQILAEYADYAAREPVFSLESGVYAEVSTLTLESMTDGFIYYTLDGSTPTQNSMVYEKPVVLQSGDYTVKALFVNMYGVQSKIVTKNYYISLSIPKVPDINPVSGTYTEPQMIEIYHDADTKIYYTIDGSTPTKSSFRYTEPIEMMYGTSNLSVVAINEKGIASDVVRRTYQLSVQANFQTELALQVLINQLVVEGKLTDVEGHVPHKLGINSYDVKSVVNIHETLYYIVAEKYTDTTNKEHDTNNLYAIDVNTAQLYDARKLGEGKYYLSPIG